MAKKATKHTKPADLDASAKVTELFTDARPNAASPDIIKKPEFLNRVMAKTTVKKRDAKPAVEAALAVLAEALAAGEELNLQPLGKLKVLKSKSTQAGGKVFTVKLRTRPEPTRSPVDPLAEVSDEG